ncbi:hypothetical protein ACIRP7_23080 [Streptomyces sp. NPDC102270]|uniref:hypothetical protein n=1 Tax=Streptomyces sp. NPDC102270 TaxID=3366150 RepID=UPI0038151503
MTPVVFTVHELKRLARNAAELRTLSVELQAGGIQLELLTGPLTGIYDPNGMGAMPVEAAAHRGQGEIVRQPGLDAGRRHLVELDAERLGVRRERVHLFGFKCDHEPPPS